MKKLLILGIIFAVLLAQVVSATTTYTENKIKVCEKNICDLKVYAGTRFGYEDNTWKLVEEMKSLKGTSIECAIDYDGVHKVECLDWNYTAVKLKFYDSNIPENEKSNIPVKVYQYDSKQEGWREKSSVNIDLSSNKELELSVPVNYGERIHFGKESTIITLEDANTENLDDVYINEKMPDTNYQAVGSITTMFDVATDKITIGMIKFAIPDEIKGIEDSILQANLSLYINTHTYTGVVEALQYDNQTWFEEEITWNKLLATPSTYTQISTIDSSIYTTRLPLNITEWVANQSRMNMENVSIIINGTTLYDIGDKQLSLNSKESANIPFLQLIYSTEDIDYGVNSTAYDLWTGDELSGWSITFTNTTYTITYNDRENPSILNWNKVATGTVNVTFHKTGYENLTFIDLSINSTHMENITAYLYPNITFYNCSSTDPNIVLTFSLKEEETPGDFVAGNFEATFTAWQNISELRYYNFSLGVDKIFYICIPNGNKVYADAIIDYRDDAPLNFSIRQYYLANATLINTSMNNISLYLLNESLSSYIKINVQSPEGIKQNDVIIRVQRLYIGEDTYRTVVMGKTNFDGYDTLYLRANDIFYRFILEQDNKILRTFTPFKITNSEITLVTDPAGLGKWFNYIGNFAWYCSFNNATNITSCTYSDTSGLERNICLIVKEKNLINSTQICSTCDTSSGSTLICNLGNVDGRMFYYELVGHFGAAVYTFESGWLDFYYEYIWGNTGLLVTIVLLIISALMGAYSPPIAVGINVIALILAYSFGFLEIGFGAVIGIIIVGAIILYKMRS